MQYYLRIKPRIWEKEGNGVLGHWGVGEKLMKAKVFYPITPLPHHPNTLSLPHYLLYK